MKVYAASLQAGKQRTDCLSGRHRETGFSMAEFLVSTTVMLVMITMGMSLLYRGQDAFSAEGAKTLAQARARRAINLMFYDIRSAGARPTDVISGEHPGIISGTSNVIRVVTDRNGNGKTDTIGEDAGEDVTYTFANGVITRSSPNEVATADRSAVLVQGVESMVMKYYDLAGDELPLPLSDLDRVRVVRIGVNIVTQVIEQGKVTGTITVESPVTLRNNSLDSF